MDYRGFLTTIVLALMPCMLVAQHPPAEMHYQLPFGPNPYLPSTAQANFNGFLVPSDFPPASYCARCHQTIHTEWRESAHANAFRAPFYTKNVQLLIDQKGIEFTRHCEGCHNPVALFTGALTKGSKVNRSFDEDGITCSVCHSIQKIQNTSGTGSYVMGLPAVMVDEKGEPQPGLPPYYEIFADVERHRKAVMRPFYKTSEFCAVCHKAAVPKELNGYRWLRAFSVYDEWQNASWAKESPAPFYQKDSVSTCQSCHMPMIASQWTAGPPKVASHRWLGANTAIPTYYGYAQQLSKVTDFLKQALRIDLFAIDKEQPVVQRVAPVGLQSFVLTPGETITANVVIQNSGAGHSLVPEQRDFYECWVEFIAKDATGHVFFHSGGLDKKGSLDPTAHSYTNRLLSGDGKWLDHHQVWESRTKGYDNTILPGRSDLVRYRFWVPADAVGPITLIAQVKYRRFRRAYTDFIFPGEDRDFPVVTLVTTEASINLGDNKGAAITAPRPTLLRWNNFGIALLGQFQYGQAEEVFKKTIDLDPKYVDGYINVALAHLSNLVDVKKETVDGPGTLSPSYPDPLKFESSLGMLKRALEIEPGNSRALYYEGVVFRYQQRIADAIQRQLAVIERYPRFRQGRQELGYDYYLAGNYASAREQFEVLQNINPDDLTSHYYLGLIYSKLGMSAASRKQGAFLAEHREDPTVGVIAQDFWRLNPILVNEITPYHLHTGDMEVRKQTNVGGFLP